MSAAAVEAPLGAAAQATDFFVEVGACGVTVVATAGLFHFFMHVGELKAKVAASEKAISDARSGAAAMTKNNTDAANATIAATSAVIAANKDATSAIIAANEKAANAAIAATEAKLAAAEKVIAAMMAGVSVTAELATLKALKGEPKRETPPRAS